MDPYIRRYATRYAKATKEPRQGTRVRAVFDYLLKNPNGSSWSSLKFAYENAAPALNTKSRQFTSMELSRVLKRYAHRVSRGVYELDANWRHLCPDERWHPEPAAKAKPEETPRCTCGKHWWGPSRNGQAGMLSTWPDGYPDFDDELHFLNGTACKQWKGSALGEPDPAAVKKMAEKVKADKYTHKPERLKVGDWVEIVQENEDIRRAGYKSGDVVQITWAEGEAERLGEALVEISGVRLYGDLNTKFFEWRFKKTDRPFGVADRVPGLGVENDINRANARIKQLNEANENLKKRLAELETVNTNLRDEIVSLDKEITALEERKVTFGKIEVPAEAFDEMTGILESLLHNADPDISRSIDGHRDVMYEIHDGVCALADVVNNIKEGKW